MRNSNWVQAPLEEAGDIWCPVSEMERLIGFLESTGSDAIITEALDMIAHQFGSARKRTISITENMKTIAVWKRTH